MDDGRARRWLQVRFCSSPHVRLALPCPGGTLERVRGRTTTPRGRHFRPSRHFHVLFTSVTRTRAREPRLAVRAPFDRTRGQRQIFCARAAIHQRTHLQHTPSARPAPINPPSPRTRSGKPHRTPLVRLAMPRWHNTPPANPNNPGSTCTSTRASHLEPTPTPPQRHLKRNSNPPVGRTRCTPARSVPCPSRCHAPALAELVRLEPGLQPTTSKHHPVLPPHTALQSNHHTTTPYLHLPAHTHARLSTATPYLPSPELVAAPSCATFNPPATPIRARHFILSGTNKRGSSPASCTC